MPNAARESYYCEKCNRTMGREQFYQSNNLEKYPDEGILPKCKKCITMHVDNWNSDTYLWILQEIDVPYIPDEWNKLMAKYAQDPSKVTGMTILGRYLSKMKLKQFRDYRWKDSEFLQQLNNNKIEETMKRQGYDAQQIAEAVSRASVSLTDIVPPPPPQEEEVNPFIPELDETPFDLGLTDEDITYLRLKWGKMYKPEEWVKLEQLYNEMMNSYDIQSAGHIDTLKLVCKTSLKANQLIDLGDVEGFQKMEKAYDSLMKAGKFTAAQNKAENGEYVDSISELVAICEEQGFIPRYYTDGPQDKVDRVLEDLQRYTHDLVTGEMGLGNLIENAIKQIERDRLKEEMEEMEDIDEDEQFEDDLFDYDKDTTLTDEDFANFKDFEESLEDINEDFFASLEGDISGSE